METGIPDSDTFRRVLERLAPEMLSEYLYDWLGCHRAECSVISIDGKTIRGSKSESHRAYHVVSAFVAENQLVLGEVVTEEKSNEITAVPEFLDSMNIKNSIMIADAIIGIAEHQSEVSSNEGDGSSSQHSNTSSGLTVSLRLRNFFTSNLFFLL